MGRLTVRRKVRHISADDDRVRMENLAVEEPLEIRVNGQQFSVTMRTPGNDIDLLHGLLFSENVIATRADISTARYCAGTDENGQNTYNVLDVDLVSEAPLRFHNLLTNSACGVCGTSSLEQLRRTSVHDPSGSSLVISARVLADTVAGLPKRQKVFASTGGLHAAALFTGTGSLQAAREDIGRHNAVDKVIGWAIQEDLLPLHDSVLVVSGRASFELVQKAALAGIPVLAAVSAPSSLAVELAEESGVTVVGFVRGHSMNVYTRPDRVT
ncbi:MAG: formate dehydrogenase accessory sulfurtransferase FdhD [Nocardiaceae bacterium]|nr:formate dehydrogenase accessory sulfurtransferase FdhD [Nocardiaceae bacterium]